MALLNDVLSSPSRVLFWAFWSILHALLFAVGFLRQKNDPFSSDINRIGSSLYVSRGCAFVLVVDCTLLLLPICRTFVLRSAPILSGKFNIPLGNIILYHKIIAWTILFFVILHVIGHMINFATLQSLGLYSSSSLHLHSMAGITGWLMVTIMILMYTTAHKPIRRAHFNLFQNVHNLALLFFVLLFFHPASCIVTKNDGECNTYFSYRIILPVYLIYLGERALRIRRSFRKTRILDAIAHPGGMIELRIFAVGFNYTAGQHAYLQIPAVSHLQWHAFSITSAPHQEYVSFHINRVGDWTNATASLLSYSRSDTDTPVDIDPSADIEKASLLPMPISLDGPFGTLTTGMFDHDVAVLVGGGIGVTPFASILKDLLWRRQNNTTGKLRRVEFYWICRTMDSFEWFRDDLARLEGSSANGFLRVHTHLTNKQSTLPSEEKASLLLGAQAPAGSEEDSASLDANPFLRTRRGRPDFSQVFGDIVTEYEQDAAPETPNPDPNPNPKLYKKVKVGIYMCGSASLRNAIRTDAKNSTTKTVEFDVFW